MTAGSDNEAQSLASFRAARGVAPSPWIMALPFFLRAPIIFLYVDILEPEDDFLTQLRKLVFAVCVFLSGCPVASVVYNWLTIDSADVSSGSIVARGCALFMPLSWIGTYLLARFTKMDSADVALIFVLTTWAELFAVAVSYIDWPQSESMLLLCVVSQLIRVPKLPLMVGLCVLGHVVASHNSNAYERGAPEYALWAFPGAIMRHYASRMLQAMVSLSSVVIVLAALQLQLFESDKLTQQAQASSDLALEVAQHLGDYDTDGAVELLGEAQGAAEPKLLEAMSVLVDNLNKYRPHLPNWMLPSHLHLQHAHGSEEDAASSRQSPRRERDSSSVRSSTRSKQSARSKQSNKQHHSKEPSAAVIASPSTEQWLRGGAPFDSFVSFATLSYKMGLRCAAPDNLSMFVDRVHHVASQTGAAVHSFIGDTVTLTWNAASRAVQSEAKAARAVARLASATDTLHDALELYGSIVSGKMRVQMAGGSDGKQQQALTVSAPWLAERVRAVMDTARRWHCVAVDYPTRSGASHAAHHHPLAAMTVDNGVDDKARLGVYQLVGEAKEDDADEWMYVLQQHENQSGNTNGEGSGSGPSLQALLKALDLWVKSDDAAAMVAIAGPQSLDTSSHGSFLQSQLTELLVSRVPHAATAAATS